MLQACFNGGQRGDRSCPEACPVVPLHPAGGQHLGLFEDHSVLSCFVVLRSTAAGGKMIQTGCATCSGLGRRVSDTTWLRPEALPCSKCHWSVEDSAWKQVTATTRALTSDSPCM